MMRGRGWGGCKDRAWRLGRRLLPVRGDGLDRTGSGGGGEKWLDPRCTLEVVLPGFYDVACE